MLCFLLPLLSRDDPVDMATPDAMPTTVSIADINPERAGILKGALFGVLRSDAAQKVIAQAIDGLPIREAYELTTTKRFELFTRHEPSQDSMTRAKEFCTYSEMFDNLELNARVCFSMILSTELPEVLTHLDRLPTSINSHLSTLTFSICIF